MPVDRRVVEGVLGQDEDSLLWLIVFPSDICDHSFKVMVDANFNIWHTGKGAS